MEIPYDQLSPSALRGLIEAFVLREGTDYGSAEVPLSIKVRQVEAQLKSGQALIVFDEESETANIVPADRPGPGGLPRPRE